MSALHASPKVYFFWHLSPPQNQKIKIISYCEGVSILQAINALNLKKIIIFFLFSYFTFGHLLEGGVGEREKMAKEYLYYVPNHTWKSCGLFDNALLFCRRLLL